MKRRRWFVVLGLVVVGVLAFVVVPQLGGGTPQVKGLLGEPNNWAQVRESGDSSPPKRDNCCMVYDSAVDRVLLFGGNSQQGNDTWAYDPASNTWTNMDPGGSIPVARWGPAQAVLDMPASPLNGVVVMFGGHNNSQAMSLNDTWLYDPVANKWEVAIAGDDSSGDLPTPRLGASMEYDPASGHVLMFGGWNASKYKLYNDLWAYDPVENAWTELVPGGPVPPVRDGSGFARDPGTGKIILFGGVGFDSGLNLVELGDTWSYDPASNSWMELHPATAPSSRDGMNMVYDPHTRLMLLFGGGEEGINVKDDTWAYDPMRNNWENLDPAGLSPSARMNYNMVFDNTRNRIVLFGGAYDHWNVLLGDTWIYTPPLFSH